MFQALFGKKKENAGPPTKTASRGGVKAEAQNPIETIKSLQETLDTLEKREAFITKKAEACQLEAKDKLAKGDKKGALFCLKRKKMYEQEVEKLQGSRITLDAQIMSLQSASVNIQTFQSMQQGANTLKGMRGNIDADKVDDMMAEMEEERSTQDAISEAISRPAHDMFDDEDLLAELNTLEETELAAPAARYKAPAAAAPAAAPAASYSLPSAPTTKVKPASHVEEDEDERALRELQESMLA